MNKIKLLRFAFTNSTITQIGGKKKVSKKNRNKKKYKHTGGDADSISTNHSKSLNEICEGSVDLSPKASIKISKNPASEFIDANKCAPSKKYGGDTCFSFEAIITIVNAYNKYCDKISQNAGSDNKTSKSNLVLTKISYNWNPQWSEKERNEYKKILVKELHSRLKDICQDQLCWIKQKFMKEIKDNNILLDITKNTFRPKAPKGKFTWLGTSNINHVMGQYETLYKHFKFLGALPIDFDDISDMLPINIKNLDYDKLYNNKIYQLGAVFNLDPHYKSGSHWVAMFADLKNGSVEFFDSAKGKPYKRIRILMERIANFIKKKHNKDATILINNVRHQLKKSECGVYSINFVLRRVKGETFQNITQKITDDDTINKCRTIYFR